MAEGAETETGPLALGRHLIMAFASPVVVYPWPDSEGLNAGLRDVILDEERQQAGVVRTNVGGWHSASEFLDREVAGIKTLRQRIRRMTIGVIQATAAAPNMPQGFDVKIDGWANVSRHGNYHSVHSHPGSVWSGTYYVSSGVPRPDTPVNGRLELLDPRVGAGIAQPDGTIMGPRYVITPTPGLMVMFPSWLSHLVHPFYGDGERISVAFNISLGAAHADRTAQ